MKLASAVVLYNPDKSILDNIQTYLPFSDVLYVMDNSSQDLEFVDEIKKLTKVEYISMHGNQGIAAALKAATEKAIADGYDFLLTMDQDSKYPTEDFKYVKDYLTKLEPDVALVSINYTGSGFPSNDKGKSFVQSCPECITSGTIMNLKAYQNVFGFNADLFVDYVDLDLSFQFLERNFRLIVFPNILLEHSLGEVQNFKFLWINRVRCIHSPLRYYYAQRNSLYLKKYKSKTYNAFFKKSRHYKDFSFFNILKKILLQKNHFHIYKMIRRGIHDGKKGILGPYKEKNK